MVTADAPRSDRFIKSRGAAPISMLPAVSRSGGGLYPGRKSYLPAR